MASADKRARKKENARAAREERQAAVQRRKRVRTARNVGIVLVIFVGVIVLLNATGGGKKKAAAPGKSTTTLPAVLPAGCVSTVPKKTTKPLYKAAPPFTLDGEVTYVAHIETTCGAFEITLDAHEAPKTVNSFVFLAKTHFYDGLSFHRVAKDFLVQGGDPLGNGKGTPGYSLATDPPKNGYRQGSVAMANAGRADSTGSQFFVVLTAAGAKNLGGPPYDYSILGKVTKGFDVVKKLGSLYSPSADPNDPSTQTPRVPIYMFKVTIKET